MSERYLISPCCGAVIDMYYLGRDKATCPACSRTYEVRENIDFAVLSSPSITYFKWADYTTYIVRYYFQNMTLEAIEGVAEHIKALPLREKRPLILLPIFKAIHDCLKKRLQQYLVLDHVPNLSSDKKAQIEIDLPLPGNNLKKLLSFLGEAYPHENTRILDFMGSNNINMLLWIRNKEEHIATTFWPLPSYVHVDKTKLPSDKVGHLAELNVPLAVDLMNFAIDLLKFIYDLEPKDVDKWHYWQLDQHRIHCTV
jgi:hypothetical protein